MKNINLKTLYGKKYKVTLDLEIMYDDRAVPRGKVPTGEEWYCNLLCHYGVISLDGGTSLLWYCPGRTNSKNEVITISKQMTIKLKRKHPEVITNFIEADKERIIFFDVKDIEIIFEYARPRARRKLSAQQKIKAIQRLHEYRFKKKV